MNEELPIVDADEPPENEDWILSPEKRAEEVALFDMIPSPPKKKGEK